MELIYGGLAAADVQKAVEKEFEMALQDRVMEETKEKKNAVEAYVYEMRNKVSYGYPFFMMSFSQCWILTELMIFLFFQLHDKYQDFVTESQREELSGKLQEVEDWLYEDGEDETKGVYIAKLEELKKVSDDTFHAFIHPKEENTDIDHKIYSPFSVRDLCTF